MENNDKNYNLTPQEFSRMVRVSTSTLRRWERDGFLSPQRSNSGHRRYSFSQVKLAKTHHEEAQKNLSRLSKERVFIPASNSNSSFTSNSSNFSKSSIYLFLPLKKFGILGGLGVLGILSFTVFTFLPLPVSKGVATQKPLFKNYSVAELKNKVLGLTSAKVLASADVKQDISLIFNIPTIFKKNIKARGQNLDLGVGNLTAGNVLYTLKAGSGVTVTTGQDPTISNTGVLSFNGEVGELEFEAGDGIEVDGLQITNSDLGSAQAIFKNIKVGANTITSTTNSDTLTIDTGTGVSATADTVGKKITFTTPWSRLLTTITPTESSDTIATLGNVGVGTSAPQSMLSVGSSSQFQVNNLGDIIRIKSLTYSWPSLQATTARQVLTNDGSGNLTWGSLLSVDVDDDTLDFTEFKDNMTLDATTTVAMSGYNFNFSGVGNVGIGTTSPTYKLDISGTGRFTGDLRLTGAFYDTSSSAGSLGQYLKSTATGTAWTSFIPGTDTLPTGTEGQTLYNNAGVWTANSGLYYDDVNGRVGIGTTNPVSLLDVHGTSWLRGTSGGTSGLFVNSSGNVGVGTTGPSYKMEIVSNDANALYIHPAPGVVAGYPTIQLGRTSAGGVLVPGGAITSHQMGLVLSTADGNVPAVVLNPYTNVGINIAGSGTPPGSKLSVNGNFAVGSTYYLLAAPSGGAIIEGNVGIGTTSPLAKLHVEGQCVTGDTLLKRRCRRKGKNGQWIDEWEDVRIDEIKTGDEILTLDETTGEFVVSKVNKLMDMGIKQTYLLITETGKNIRTTANHPYFVRPAQAKIVGGTYEVDQSNRVEETNKNTFIAIASGPSKRFAAQIKVETKLEMLLRFGRKRFFAPEIFAGAIVALLKKHRIKPGILVLDQEYPGYERIIDKIIKTYDKDISISYRSIGKDSLAHLTAYALGSKKGNKKMTVAPLVGDAVSLHPEFTGIRDTHGQVAAVYQKKIDLSSGKWVKVKDFGRAEKLEVITSDGWEKIISIKPVAQEQVYDIEVENTHNFVGNEIVAHNTYISTGLGVGSGSSTLGSGAVAAFMNGNVGIGTTSPAQKLHVEGQCVTGDTLLSIAPADNNHAQEAVGNWLIADKTPIKDIKEGSYVYSLDEDTNRIVPARVKALYDMGVKPVFKITTNDGRTIRTTGNHPYLVSLINNQRGGSYESAEQLIQLRGAESLAKFHGISQDDLRADTEFSQTRTVWLSGSTASSSGLGSPQHRGRQGQTAYSGVYPVSLSSQRESLRDSDLSQTGNQAGLSDRSTNQTNDGILSRDSSSDQRSHQISQGAKASWIKVIYLREGDLIAVPNQLSAASQPQVLWARITSIEFSGYEQVYDIEVEGTHNFIGNNIFAHNTYLSGNVGIGTTNPGSYNLNVTGTGYFGGVLSLGTQATLTSHAVRADRSLTLTSDSNITITNSGTAQDLTSDRSWTLGWTGLLPLSRGGTGVGTTNPSNGTLLIGTGTGYAVSNITGTANQITVTNGSGTIGLSLPQDIATSSSPTFTGLGIGATNPSYSINSTGSINLTSGNAYYINGSSVLNSTTLGSGVTSSSLTTVGALTSGSITPGFGNISTGSTITTTGTIGTASTTTFTGGGATFTGLTVGSLNGILKGTMGIVGTATAGTDYIAGGVGSQNQVAYFTGTGALTGSNNFWFNGSNVGIGITNPQSTLEIGGSGNLRIGGLTASQGIYTDSNKQLTSTPPTSGTLGYWQRNSTYVSPATITDYIGIGTTFPVSMLDVRGTTYLRGADANQGLYVNSSGNVGIGSTAPASLLDVNGTAWLRGTAGGIGGLYVKSDGNVGVGTTGPGYQLETAAAGSTAYAHNAISLYNAGSVNYYPYYLLRKSKSNTLGTITQTVDTDILGAMLFQGVTSGSAFSNGARIYAVQNGTSGASYIPTNLVFATSDGTASYADRVIITSGGNIGIGTTNPGYKLDVQGAAAATTALLNVKDSATTRRLLAQIVNGNTEGLYIWHQGSDGTSYGAPANSVMLAADYTSGGGYRPLVFATNNAARVTIATDGNVGIGSTAPASLLDVNGTAWLRGTAGGIGGLYVKSDGNVGVGTTGPGAKLTLNTDTPQDGIRITSELYDVTGSPTNGTGLEWRWRSTQTNPFSYIRSIFHGSGNSTLAFGVAPSGISAIEMMRLSGTGLGIGDASPAYLLTVGSGDLFGVNSSGYALHPAGAVGTPSISFTGDTNTGLYSTTADKLGLVAGGTETMTITSGNVGIGSTAPASLLDVNGTAWLRGTAGGIGGLYVKSDGNVGVGTTGPVSKLNLVETSGSVTRGFTLDQYSNDAAGTWTAYRKARGTPSSPTAIQNGDYIGSFAAQPYDGSSFFGTPAYMGFVVNGTVATGSVPTDIVFRTGAATSTEYMRITSNGNVGIGSTAPASLLDVNGTAWLRGTAGGIGGLYVKSDGNVGVGTTGPGEKLQIGDSGYTSDTVNSLKIIGRYNGNNYQEYSSLQFTASADLGGNSSIISAILGDSNSKRGLDFKVYNGTSQITAMRMKHNGYIGIGTTNPTKQLDVVGGILADSVTVTGVGQIGPNGTYGFAIYDTGTSTFRGQMYGRNSGGISGYQFTNSGGANTFLVGDNGNVGVGNINPAAMFDVNNVFVVQSSGNVGIGSIAPVSLLDVHGTSWLRGTTGGTSGLYVNSSGNVGIGTTSPGAKLDVSGNIFTSYGSGGYLQLNETDNTRRNRLMAGADANGSYINATYSTGGTATLRFQTATADKMVIDINGNVGIGTTGPNYALHISGSGNKYVGVESSNGLAGLVLRSNGATKWNFTNDNTDSDKLKIYSTSSTPLVTIDSTGNVGIGTTNPQSALEIGGSGNLRIGGLTASMGVYTDANKQLTNTPPTSGTLGYWTRSGTTLWPSTNTDNVTTLGNVGIGTTGPNKKLHVAEGIGTLPGITDGTELILQNNDDTTDNTYLSLFSGATGTTGLLLGRAGDQDRGYITYNQGTDLMLFGTSAGDKVAINSTGNVGIGSTAPASLLDVNGTAWLRGTAGGIGGLYVKSDGNVGVGTTSPSSLLELYKATAPSLKVSDGTDAVYLQIEGSPASPRFVMDDNQASGKRFDLASGHAAAGTFSIYDFDASQYRFVIDTNGNIGIGTTNPGQKLQVAGRIRMDTWTADGDTAVYKDDTTGDIGIQTSDIRLKKNLTPITNALTIIKNLHGYTYNTLDEEDTDNKRVGLVAQDLLSTLPEATYKFNVEGSNENYYYGIHYEKLTAVLAEAIKEQQVTLDTVTGELNTVKSLADAQSTTDSLETSEILASHSREIASLKDLTTANVVSLDQIKAKVAFLDTQLGLLGALGIGTTEPGVSGAGVGSTAPALPKLEDIFAISDKEIAVDRDLVVYKNLNVLGQTTLANLAVTGKITTGLLVIDGVGENGVSLAAISGDIVLQNLVTITSKGDVVLKSGVIAGNSSFRDAEVLPLGVKEIAVSRNWETSPVTITVTPSYESTAWVENITKDGFTIKLGTASETEQKVYWLAVW